MATNNENNSNNNQLLLAGAADNGENNTVNIRDLIREGEAELTHGKTQMAKMAQVRATAMQNHLDNLEKRREFEKKTQEDHSQLTKKVDENHELIMGRLNSQYKVLLICIILCIANCIANAYLLFHHMKK